MNTVHNRLEVVVKNYMKLGMSPTKFKVEILKAVGTEKLINLSQLVTLKEFDRVTFAAHQRWLVVGRPSRT